MSVFELISKGQGFVQTGVKLTVDLLFSLASTNPSHHETMYNCQFNTCLHEEMRILQKGIFFIAN
jgi:hypothetical protein